MSSDWLTSYLRPGQLTYQTRHGLTPGQWRGRSLSAGESHGLERAYAGGLIELDDDGTALISRFHKVKRYQLYINYDGGTARPGRAWSWSWQEAFTQIAFAAELVIDHGWPASAVALEVDRLDVAAGPDPVNAPALVAEAKLHDAGPAGLQAMLAVFEELRGGPTASVSAGARANATPKYEGLLRLRPRVFVAVAPEVQYRFDVRYVDGSVTLSARLTSLSRELV